MSKDGKRAFTVQTIKTQVKSDLEKAKEKNDELIEATKTNIADLICCGNVTDSNDEIFQKNETSEFGPPLFKSACLEDVHIKAVKDFQEVENATRDISKKTRKELLNTINIFFANPAGQKTNEEIESEEFIKDGIEVLKEKIVNDLLSTKHCTDAIAEKTKAQLSHMNESEIQQEYLDTKVQNLLSFSVEPNMSANTSILESKQLSRIGRQDISAIAKQENLKDMDKEKYNDIELLQQEKLKCAINSECKAYNQCLEKYEKYYSKKDHLRKMHKIKTETTGTSERKVYDKCVGRNVKSEDKQVCDSTCNTLCKTLK